MSKYAVTDPGTGEVVSTYPGMTDAEIESAVRAAGSVVRGWRRSNAIGERCDNLREAARLHRERASELAELARREMGKPLEEGIAESQVCADIYDYYATRAAELLADEPLVLGSGDGSAVIRRTPLGVIMGVMPWNFPYYQVARFAAPNLAAGNVVLVKHSAQCPSSAEAQEKIMREAGFPVGAYTDMRVTTGQVGAIVSDSRVAGVSLTGSERAGAAVASIAGANLKKVVLELGGSDPFILMSTGDLDSVIEQAVGARLYNAGQACNAPKRFIIKAELYDEFLERFTAQMHAAGSSIAPLASVSAAVELEKQVNRAVAAGASCSEPCRRDGAVFRPLVLTDMTPDNPVYGEELFGPVATVHRVGGEAEAIEVANSSPFGLGSYVFTTDPEQADRIAEALDAGMVFVNSVANDGPDMPFGGVKRSGFGRELGPLGIDEFVNRKLIRT